MVLWYPPVRFPLSATGLSPSMAGLSRSVRLEYSHTFAVGPNPYRLSGRFGLLPFRSPLLGESLLLSFPRATEMFQFARFPSADYGFISGCLGITPSGFPHSEIPGSTPACGSPGRFAACRVLHRLQVPGHPPCALTSLDPFRLCAVFKVLTRKPSKVNSGAKTP